MSHGLAWNVAPATTMNVRAGRSWTSVANIMGRSWFWDCKATTRCVCYVANVRNNRMPNNRVDKKFNKKIDFCFKFV